MDEQAAQRWGTKFERSLSLAPRVMFQGYGFAMTIPPRGGGTPRGGEGFLTQSKVFG